MSSGQLILKILSGAYSGAELSLDKLEYILGSALEADISIEDAHLSPSHFKIELKPDEFGNPSIHIHVLSQAYSIAHNNRRVESKTFEVRPCDRVQVGEFVFGIGPAETAWPPYEQILERDKQEELAAEQVAFEAEQRAKEEAEKEAAADAAQANEAASSDQEAADHPSQREADAETKVEAEGVESVGGVDDETSDEAEGEEGAEASKVDKGVWQRIAYHKGIIVVSIAALTLLISTVMLIEHTSDSDSNDVLAESVSPALYPIASNSVAIAHAYVDTRAHMSETPVSKDTNQITSETSLIPNATTPSDIVDTDQREVWQPSESELKILDDAKKSAVSMFEAFRFSHLQVEQGTQPLTLIVRGYTYRVDSWNKLKALLNRDIGNINKIIDYVETPWTRKKQLENMLSSEGLGDESEVYMTEQGLLVKTSLSVRDEPKWLAVEREYMTLYRNQPALYRIKDKTQWLDIKSVNFGYEPYIVTANGTKYLVGAHVKNGYILERITRDGIVLNNDGQIKNFPLP